MIVSVFEKPVPIGTWVVVLVLLLPVKFKTHLLQDLCDVRLRLTFRTEVVHCGQQVARNAVGVPAKVQSPLTLRRALIMLQHPAMVASWIADDHVPKYDLRGRTSWSVARHAASDADEEKVYVLDVGKPSAHLLGKDCGAG
jgi:hypothetical protein